MTGIQTFRFDYSVPGSFSDFDPKDFIEKAEAWVKSLVKPGERIALSASGGVDSTVAAFLLDRIVGANQFTFFLEDGCRRLIDGMPEGDITKQIFSRIPNFTILQVKEKIMPRLIGLSDGEEKRKAFISGYKKVSDDYITEKGLEWIADGTIAPDIRETEGNFKSQHNVGWNYSVRKLEVLSSLAKPQVRKVGAALGLPESFVHRIPCPGPAQIVRTVGEFTEEKLRTSQLASDAVEQEVEKYYQEKHGRPYLYEEATGVRTPFQYFGFALDPAMEPDPMMKELADRMLGCQTECFRMSNMTTVVPEEGKRPEKPIYKPVSWIIVRGGIDYERLEELSRKAWEQLELPRILVQLFENPSPRTRLLAGIKAVESEAAARSMPIRFDQEKLVEMARKVGEHTGAARVAYDVSIKPPATIEFE
jgi:GMP synthase (glutamine-hydrolysing)